MDSLRDHIIKILKDLNYNPKIIKRNVIYFEDFSLIFKKEEVFIHFDVNTYPDIAALISVTIFEICRAENYSVKIGPIYSPVYDAFGNAINIVFGEEAKKEYEDAAKRFYINQENITNFLRKVDPDSLHQC